MSKFTKSFVGVISLCLFAALSQTVVAQSQSDMTFENGVVAIHCKSLNENDIPENVFNEAFPQWIINLQELANSGEVARVHYLPRFRSGVFILVNGETIEKAKENAEKISQMNADILAEALSKIGIERQRSEEDTCELIEIGPVAILPKE